MHHLTRDDIFIITKANIQSPDVRENAINMIENSLSKLKTKFKTKFNNVLILII